MDFEELTEEQRRQLVDAQQLFAALHPVATELETGPRFYWNTSKGRRYLYEQKLGERRSLGKETPALTQLKIENDDRVRSLRSRVRSLKKRVDEMAPVNRAIGIARMPTIAARIVRELEREGLLGRHIVIAGTNALYAYETAAGVLIGGRYTTTSDADLLWDTRQSLLLSARSVVRREGLMSVLRRVDRTFTAEYGLIATNARGYVVDLIVPESEEIPAMRPEGDIEATPIEGVEWLLDAPFFERTVVGADGVPLRLVVPEPRTFALHKLWVARRADRNPVKKIKDIAHARIVSELAKTYLGSPFVVKDMTWLAKPLRDIVRDVKKGRFDAA